MFGFLKGLVSSEKIIDGGMSAMDKLVFTDEEKSDMKMKFIKATMPMNRARRFLAIIVGGVWAIHAILGAGLIINGSKIVDAFIPYMLQNISIPFGVIVGFYFFNERLASGKMK